MGCAAWFTNSKIIATLSSNVKGCCVIITKDKIMKPNKKNKNEYFALDYESILHNKTII